MFHQFPEMNYRKAMTNIAECLWTRAVPKPFEAELSAIFKVVDRGRRRRPITTKDEMIIQDEIDKYRAKRRNRKA